MAYNEQQTKHIVEEYEAEPSRATVDRLAAELEVSPRSIIAKLSFEGVYRTPKPTDKTGQPVVKKDELAKDIGDAFGVECPSLMKAGKLDLLNLRAAIMNPDNVRAHLVDLEVEE